MRFQRIALEKIDQQSVPRDPEGPFGIRRADWDEFLITYKPEIEEIAVDLKRLGQIYPVILEERGNDRYRIVAGFVQIGAARKTGWQSIEAKIFEQGEIPPQELFLLALSGRILEDSISPVEKAVALKKALTSFGFKEEEIGREIAPLLDIPPSRKVIRNYLALADADEAIRDAVHFGHLPANQAFLLLPFEAADRLALSNLFQNLRPSFNEAKEILRNMGDVARMQKKPIKEILALKEIERILQDETLPRPQAGLSKGKKREHLRQTLKKLRYPLLSETREEMYKRLKALALSPEVRVTFDPTFEKEEIAITLEAKDEEKLACALKTLQAALAAGKFASIFSLLEGRGPQEGKRDEV
ncbi:MAG: hypothetical protein AMS15_04220 [Planctomycetes bacterium DG_23]|nr:MAG: hypothetical protein AMS15_04220 [Planctomycetes bacterium DG_23]